MKTFDTGERCLVCGHSQEFHVNGERCHVGGCKCKSYLNRQIQETEEELQILPQKDRLLAEQAMTEQGFVP